MTINNVNKEETKKVIVAHPFRQHSFNVATALEQENMLFAYCTTVYDKPESLMGIVKKVLNSKWKKKANGRKCAAIPNEKVKLFCELRGYFALIVNRFCPSTNIVRMYQRHLYKCFGKKVAKYVRNNEIDAIIMFDTTASECFEILKKECPNTTRILDMSALALPYIKYIYETQETGDSLLTIKKTQAYLWNDKVMNYLCREFEYADKFIAASSITKKSLMYSGVSSDKISIIPYGVNTIKFSSENHQHRKEILKILYVGHVDYRKGVHHLLNVVNKMENVELDLYGVYHEDSPIYKENKFKGNIHFHGFVTPDKLPDIYRNSDVFVFPSTNDGFGLVVVEAMACGLPVICSDNAGAADLIDNGVNGFVYTASDEKKLERLIECIQRDPEKSKQIGNRASERAKEYTWDNYYRSIRGLICNERTNTEFKS